MRRYWRLYLAFARNTVAREMEFRANFYLLAAMNLLGSAMYLVFYSFIFLHTSAIAGWTSDQVVLLLGMYMVAYALISFLFARNMAEMSRLVNRGELDFVLMKPVNPQFFVSTRFIDPTELPRLVAGLAVVVIALRRMGLAPSAGSVLTAIVVVGCGVVMTYSVWFMVVTLVLHVERFGNVHFVFYSVVELARVPVQEFPLAARLVLAYLVPAAFISTFPSQALLSTLEMGNALLGVLAAAGLLWLSSVFWNYSLRRYVSASS